MSKRLSFSIAINLLTENFRKKANVVKDTFRSIQMQIVTFAAALGVGGLGIMGLITRLKDVVRETNRVLTALKNVSGGTKQFGDNLSFLNKLADKYGVEINGLIDGFSKFTASATQANMPMQDQRKIYESLTRASAAFSLTADENKGIMLALSQMMGKGKISSEELRKQMGEKLPIAMQAMAKAAGTSMAGLEKLLKQGKLMSADILPKFADALNDMILDVDTDNLETSISRLNNAFGEFADATGFQDKYKALIDWLTLLIKSAGENIKNIVLGVVAAIIFISSNGAIKILKGWDQVAMQMTTGSKKLEAQLASATAARVTAQNNLETARLNHSVAIGKARQRAAEKVAKAEVLYARSVVAEDKARLALTQASATASSGAWTRSLNVIKLGFSKLWVSVKSLWSSFAPAIIITALTTIGYKIYELVTATSSAEKAMQKFNSEAITESKNLNSIFDAYKKANDGTKEKDRLLNLIKSKYGEYIKNLIDEKGRIIDVDKAQRQANDSLRKSIALKVRKAALDGIEEEAVVKQAKSMGKIRGRLADKLGDVKANAMIQHIGELLSNDTEVVNGEEQKIPYSEIQRKIVDYIKQETGESQYVAKYTGLTNNDLFDIISSAQTLRNETEQIENQFKGIIGDFKEVENIDPIVTPTGGDDPDNKALRAAEKRLEALRKLDEKDRKRQIEKQKFDLDLQQKAIDVLDDSFEKRTKQTLLNLKKENLAIEEYQNELQKKQEEHLKTKYVSVKGDDKGFEAFFSDLKKNNFKDKNGINVLPEGLTPEDVAKQVKALTDSAEAEQHKAITEINKDLSVMLREQQLMFASDLTKKLADLDSFYNEQRIKAGNNATLIAQIESNRKRAKTEVTVEDKLNKLDFEEQLKQERIAGMESIGMTELVEEKKLEITRMYIQKRINALDVLASMGDQEAYKEMDLLKASLKKLDVQKPAKSLKSLADQAIFNTIKKGFEKTGDSAEEAEEKTTSLLSTISQKANTVANVVSELQSMFGGLDESLDLALETVGNIAQGFATGGIVGGAMAVVGEGMKLFSKASEAAARHRKALKEIEESRLASQRAYNLLLLEQNLLLKEAVSIFGEKQIQKATNAIANYRESLQDLKTEMQGDFTPNAAYEEYLKKGSASGGIMSKYFSNQLKDYQRQVNNYNKGIAGLAEAQIVTGHKKTGMFGRGKGKDTYSSILEVYPDVIDKEGNLNKERLQTIINTRKMSDETKAYLQNLLDLQEQAEAAQEELRSYLQSTFGSLGADIMTSLENAIKDKGVNAWEEFGKAGAKVIEELGKQIAYELFFADKFKKLQSDLEAVYGSNKSSEDISRESMDLVGQFYQNIGSQMDLAQGFMENWQKEAEKYNLNLWDKDSTQDSSKGYSVSMDQDTGGAILGRVTGLHETGLRMEALLSTISLDTSKYLAQSTSMANELKKQTDILNDSFQIHKKSYFKIEAISEGMEVLEDVKDRLTQIEKNTKGLVSK